VPGWITTSAVLHLGPGPLLEVERGLPEGAGREAGDQSALCDSSKADGETTCRLPASPLAFAAWAPVARDPAEQRLRSATTARPLCVKTQLARASHHHATLIFLFELLSRSDSRRRRTSASARGAERAGAAQRVHDAEMRG